MIVREIVEEPDFVLAHFDYFDDYDDTRKYLARHGHHELATRLREGYEAWLTEYLKDE